MSRGEAYEYPLCEEDDCYCQRHWPDRSGGEEHKVVNNDEEGELTWRCDVAIANGDYKKCDFCGKWTMGSGLELPIKYRMCMRCCYDGFDEFLEQKFKEDPCLSVKLFNNDFMSPDDPPETKIDCASCKKTHSRFEFGKDDLLYIDPCGKTGFLSGTQECLSDLSELMEKPEYTLLRDLLEEEWREFKEKRRCLKRIEKTNKRDVEYANAKRVIRSFLPDATDADAEKICNKKQRLTDLPPEKDVWAFIKWLNE